MPGGGPGPELKGDLGGGALPGLLRDLYLGRRTGLLHFTHGSDRASVCFINGHIVWGDSTMEESQLGPTMVRHGLLEAEALERVTDLVGGGKRLGQLLLEFDLVDRKTLDQALALQVREALLAVFTWHEGGYAFEEHPAEHFRGYDQALTISTGELILDAVWAVSDVDVIRYALGDLDRALVPTTDPLLRFQRITATPTDGFILSRVDGHLTARQVLAMAPVGPEEAQRSLFGLLCVGMVDRLAAPEPAASEAGPGEVTREEVMAAARGLATKDHFEVLGLTPQASEADASAAYRRLVKRFHPDIQHRPELADLHSQIAALFDRLSQAHKVLSDPQARAEYESSLMVARFGPMRPAEAPESVTPATSPALDAQAGEEALRRAEEALGASRYWDAIQQLQPIVEEASGRTRQKARLLLARCYLKGAEGRQQAEEQLKAVLKEEPGSADAYYLLGILYRDGGLASRARVMFRRVLELKPRHTGAQAEMAALGGEPESKPAGFLKKLLG